MLGGGGERGEGPLLFPGALAEPQDFIVLKENTNYNKLLGNCLKNPKPKQAI